MFLFKSTESDFAMEVNADSIEEVISILGNYNINLEQDGDDWYSDSIEYEVSEY